MKKLILMLMLFMPMATFAQKFGHVNAQEIMASMPEFIKARGEVEAQAKQYDNDLKAMQDEMQRKYEDYEKNTGKVIIEELTKRNINPVHVPGIICASHGPFTWGKDAAQAVYHAVVLEEVAFMNFHAKLLNPAAGPMPQVLLDKHYLRKHGANAYYGQG